jgi:hypothetical protein
MAADALMVARVQSYHGHLLVTFTTDGEEPEIQLVASGERALKVALVMIAGRDVLRHGDQLAVRRADDGYDASGAPS